MTDLGLTKEQVAGIFGNFYVETGGFTLLQEQKPLIAGSKGGWGWAQWTGPRRRAFEKWADANGFDRSAEETNYQYVLLELNGPEKNALIQLKKTTTSKTAAETFCAKFERPGIPHMDRRIRAAAVALEYLNKKPSVVKAEDATTGGVVAGTAGASLQFPEYAPYIIVGGFALALVVYFGIRWYKNRNV